jgi:hypothetical protein
MLAHRGLKGFNLLVGHVVFRITKIEMRSGIGALGGGVAN